jgi:alpha-N-acetylglucosamine transferase
MIDCYKSLGQENSKKRFLLIFLAGLLFIACSKVNDISKKDIKYTVINKVVPKEHASVGKFNSTVWITIPSDISKDEIEKLILPKVYEDNIENYDSLSVFMYSDKRFRRK